MSSDPLKLALKSLPGVLRDYVRNLVAENARLQAKIAKHECSNMSSKHRVTALQKELNKLQKQERVVVHIHRDVKKKPP